MIPTGPDSRRFYRLGAWAAAVVLALVPVQMVVYFAHPPPSSIEGHFASLRESPLVGLMNLDLLYMPSMAAMTLIYLALYQALRRTDRVLVTVGLLVELLSIGVYFASNPTVELLALSKQYAAAASDVDRIAILGAGRTMLAIYEGTAFTVSYVASGIAALLFSWVMLREGTFGRTAAYAGLVVGAMSLVPATAGAVGLVFSIAALVPTVVWLALVARRLFRLAESRVDAGPFHARMRDAVA